jgi:hypothetical protein
LAEVARDCRLAVLLVKLAAALDGLTSGVHHFYDFATFHLPASPVCLYLLATVADAHTAHIDPGFLHPDLALLRITPMHHPMSMDSSATSGGIGRAVSGGR